MRKPRIVLAVTGATGILYAKSLAGKICELCDLHVIFSDAAKLVCKQETGKEFDEIFDCMSVRVWDNHALDSPLASGSNYFQALIVCPCSMKSLAQIRAGFSSCLIGRVADVCLKERRKLILAVREAPFSTIHLENMLRISEMGGIIFPLSPVFYNHPQKIDDMVDYLVVRIALLAGIETEMNMAWKAGEL